MSIEESGLGRWSRLKKARNDRAAKSREIPETGRENKIDRSRGKASPTAYPTEISGEYRPWLPPLTGEKGETAPVDHDSDEAVANEQPPDEALSTDEIAVSEELGLPDIETLKEESDFSAFLKEGVPDKLRRLALRKLWASTPLFGLRDGLNDYDEDFTVLSDYVYNSTAVKDFADTTRDADEQAANNPENRTSEHSKEQDSDDLTGDQAGVEAAEGHHENDQAPKTDNGHEASEITSLNDNESLGDDDSEFG